MRNSSPMADRPGSLGDHAVDGLLAGMAAGGGMAACLIVLGILGGKSLLATLAQFDPGPSPTPLTGLLAHVAVAGVYGSGFAMACRWLPRLRPGGRGWPAGLAYSLLLWAAALWLRATPPAASSGWLAEAAPAHLLAAHLVYGLVLGRLLSARPNPLEQPAARVSQPKEVVDAQAKHGG